MNREMIPLLRRLVRLSEEQTQLEQFYADARHDMVALIERLIELLEGTGASPELGPQPSALLSANEAKFGSNRRSKRKVWRIKGRIVRLTKTLDTLIRALAVSSPGVWRTAKDLAGQLGRDPNNVKPHAVAQAIFRLRQELQRAGLNGRMIEGRRGRGWRWKTPDEG
jgi:DNA-binding response OmpR family regulator